MRSHHLTLARLPLILPLMLSALLSACNAPPASVVSAQGNDSDSRVQADAAACADTNTDLQPLSTPENMPVYEQFNFQPQSISVAANAVTVKTPYYTFEQCLGNRTWSVTSSAPDPELPFDYSQYARSLADPDYETIQVNDEPYEYRVRLQADWLDEQIAADDPDSAPPAPTNDGETTEESVYFDIKASDGEVTSYQLYTVQDVRAASLGASLGVPRISGAIVTGETVWFAATTSQGEGENGFASLLHYTPATEALDIQQPTAIQGDQISSMVATGLEAGSDAGELTFWLGTLRSGEGNPALPASGLVAYRPATQTLSQYTLNNSPMVGAIPSQLAAAGDSLWVGTGNGVCDVNWQAIEQDQSWDCWRFITTAKLPAEGVAIYDSFLAEKPVETLTEPTAEVLWAAWENFNQPDVDEANAFRYEVVYEPGFDVTLSQGGYRVNNEVARLMVGDSRVFWPGRQWHWDGERFVRTFDEVALNLIGGGPYGLISSNIQTGFSFDHNAIRGDFDLLSLEPDGTQVRHYSGWVDGADLEVYPDIVAVEPSAAIKPNPMDEIAANLPASAGP